MINFTPPDESTSTPSQWDWEEDDGYYSPYIHEPDEFITEKDMEIE